MSLVFSIVLNLFFSSIDAYARDLIRQPNSPTSACIAQRRIQEDDLTAHGIQNWIKNYGQDLQAVDDFVCCLPEGYLKNYVVGHSSIAAQPGIPLSPRIILFTPQAARSNGSHHFTALSINGGHESLAQNKNVEMMTFNENTQALELYDLSFEDSKKPRISGRNPETCMSCHGNGNTNPIGGPRPIFDSFGRWNRFVSGRDPFCSPAESELFKRVDNITANATQDNPRFRCLNPSPLRRSEEKAGTSLAYKEQFRILTQLDVRLAGLNRHRLTYVIRGYKDFPRIRYGLFGLFACGGTFSNWLPSDVVKKLRAMEPLSKPFRQANWREHAAEKVDLLASAHEKSLVKMNSLITSSSYHGEDSIDPPINSTLSCPQHASELKSRILQSTDHMRPQFRSELKLSGSPGDIDLINRYRIQLSLNGVNSDPVLTYIFEALGEDTSFWQMSATGDGNLTEFQPLSSTLRAEFENDEIFRKTLLRYFIRKKAYEDGQADPILILNNEGMSLFKRTDLDSCKELENFIQGKIHK